VRVAAVVAGVGVVAITVDSSVSSASVTPFGRDFTRVNLGQGADRRFGISETRAVLIALLVVLGVDLLVVVVLLAVVLGRRRWVRRQRGAFKGAIRVSAGQVEDLGPKWRKGYGRWVRDILVWTKGPFFLRNELVPTDAAVVRTAEPGEVKRLGDAPIVAELAVDDATVFVAAPAGDRELALGPYRNGTAATRAEHQGEQHG
jgi:hypothetical protein